MSDGDRPRPRLSRRRAWFTGAGRDPEAAPENQHPEAADPGRTAGEERDTAAGRQQRRGYARNRGGSDGDGRAGG